MLIVSMIQCHFYSSNSIFSNRIGVGGPRHRTNRHEKAHSHGIIHDCVRKKVIKSLLNSYRRSHWSGKQLQDRNSLPSSEDLAYIKAQNSSKEKSHNTPCNCYRFFALQRMSLHGVFYVLMLSIMVKMLSIASQALILADRGNLSIRRSISRR